MVSSKVKFKWTKIKQNPLEEIKWIVAHDVLLYYTNYNEEFKIYTDASDLQLGAVISQNGKPIAFYCGKLTGTQLSYTVT